jgi:hypothetical protein
VNRPSSHIQWVDARHEPVNLAARVLDLDVAAGRTARADGRHRVQLPGPHLEAEVLGGQRADRADVDGVQRVGIVQLVARRRRQHLAVAPVRHLQLVGLRDLVAHADAARAEDAALLIQHDVRADVDDLVLPDLDAVVARELPVPVEVVLLQQAFAGLVADRAVDRVVHQRELQHLTAHVQRPRRSGLDLHLVGDRRVAGRHRLRLSLHVDQALPADGGRRQPRVVAEERNVRTDGVARLEQHRPLGELVRFAVDRDGHHLSR